MNALVTGATGLIGRLLLDQLDQPTILTRRAQSGAQAPGAPRTVTWRPEEEMAPIEALEGCDVVFHLAGEPVATGRWTKEKKRRIRDSRVIGTRHLVQGIAACERPPKVLIAASAVGFYGDRGDEVLDEHSKPGSGFLPDVCRDWEREAMAAEAHGVRVVCLRIGIVLAQGGGALEQMIPIFRMGAGGKLGDGKQWMSWIHVDDVVGLLLWSAQSDGLQGSINAVAPQPVTNADFTKQLGEALRRPTFMPVPRFGLHALFGEKTSIILASQHVLPKVAQEAKYPFAYSDLKQALSDVVSRP